VWSVLTSVVRDDLLYLLKVNIVIIVVNIIVAAAVIIIIIIIRLCYLYVDSGVNVMQYLCERIWSFVSSVVVFTVLRARLSLIGERDIVMCVWVCMHVYISRCGYNTPG